MEEYKRIKNISKQINKEYFKRFIKSVLVPIDYTRTKEIPYLIKSSGILNNKNKKLKILDIGSPQILSLTLAKYSKSWEITYINLFEEELDNLNERKLLLNLKNINIQKGDITDINIADKLSKYDYIFSCSVFEHIHPEANGDILGSINIKKLLCDEGLFTLSVPFYKKAFNEYKNGSVYSILADQQTKTFFQRFYDKKTIEERIISPSNLKIDNTIYIGERYLLNDINKRMAVLLSGKYRSLLLGRLFKTMSDIFMHTSIQSEMLKKPYLAIVTLRNT